MQPFSFFFFSYSLWGGISGRVRALNLTVPLGSGRVGSDDLGYGPGSGFSFEPVQTSTKNWSLGSPPFVLTKELASASTSWLCLALPDSTVSRRFASADGAMRSRVDVADWRGKTGYAYIF